MTTAAPASGGVETRPVRVETAEGKLLALEDGEVVVARGVPFARPPVGELRFRPSQPPKEWLGLREATHFGPACPQPPMWSGVPIPPSVLDVRAPMSEDCLYLNVWSPAGATARLPVLVWFHGGGYLHGAGSQGWYEGRDLALALDAVVVTVNYRTNLFGWLRTRAGGDVDPPAGNMGLHDHVRALEWVRRNISAFSGDPQNVTIAGQSAGARSVLALIAVPRARDLFARAISMSGTIHAATPETAEARGEHVLATLGLESGASAALWDIEATTVWTAASTAFAEIDSQVRWPGARFGPVVDGELMTTSPDRAIVDGTLHGKTIMIGTTADETRLVPLTDADADLVGRDLRQACVSLLGVSPDAAAHVTASYSRQFPELDNRDLFYRMETDGTYGPGNDDLAAAAAAASDGAYRFIVDWTSPDDALRACHGIDIALLFGTHRAPGMARFNGEGEALETAVKRFQQAVRTFLSDGVPSIDGVSWPAFTASDGNTAMLSGAAVTRRPPLEHAIWEAVRRGTPP
jgi:para-nitrobenzyl esterase